MNVSNMTNKNGNKVCNQFIINDGGVTYFQSYDSIIAKIESIEGIKKVTLDSHYWDYSRTTSKHRSIFLNESTSETKLKIKNGLYALDNLNN